MTKRIMNADFVQTSDWAGCVQKLFADDLTDLRKEELRISVIRLREYEERRLAKLNERFFDLSYDNNSEFIATEEETDMIARVNIKDLVLWYNLPFKAIRTIKKKAINLLQVAKLRKLKKEEERKSKGALCEKDV